MFHSRSLHCNTLFCIYNVLTYVFIYRLCAVHTASMVALQNLVSALPVTVWGGPGKMAAMWGSLFDHLASSSPSPSAHGCETLVGCLLALMNKLSTSSETVVSVRQCML